MFRLGILGLIVMCALLAFTNPSFDTHRQAIYKSAAAEATNSELLGKIAADVLGGVDVLPLSYNNYFLFSTTTLKGDTASVGLLSRVWKMKCCSEAAKK
jgi:hypothetical protein